MVIFQFAMLNYQRVPQTCRKSMEKWQWNDEFLGVLDKAGEFLQTVAQRGLEFECRNLGEDKQVAIITRPVKRTNNYGKSSFWMGKRTISMAIFNSYFDITRG